MGLLILGLVILLGVHSAGLAMPDWRERMIARLGEAPWNWVYSAVSLVGLILVIHGYGLARVHPVGLWAPPPWSRHLALLLMLPAFPLLLASVLPGRIQNAAKRPVMTAVTLWALAHLLANGNLADLILFGSFLVWALADRITLGGRTPPRVRGAPPAKTNDLIALIGGLLLYGALVGGLHAWLFGVSPLGIH